MFSIPRFDIDLVWWLDKVCWMQKSQLCKIAIVSEYATLYYITNLHFVILSASTVLCIFNPDSPSVKICRCHSKLSPPPTTFPADVFPMPSVVLRQPVLQEPEILPHNGGVHLPLPRQGLQSLWPRFRSTETHHVPRESWDECFKLVLSCNILLQKYCIYIIKALLERKEIMQW